MPGVGRQARHAKAVELLQGGLMVGHPQLQHFAGLLQLGASLLLERLRPRDLPLLRHVARLRQRESLRLVCALRLAPGLAVVAQLSLLLIWRLEQVLRVADGEHLLLCA